MSASGDVALASSGPQAANLLDEILDEVDPSVTTAYVEPTTQGWALVEHADIDGHADDLDTRWQVDARAADRTRRDVSQADADRRGRVEGAT